MRIIVKPTFQNLEQTSASIDISSLQTACEGPSGDRQTGKATRSVGATLRPIRGAYRRRIKIAFAAKHGKGPLNLERRLALEQCIFDEQNELEHRSPKHPQVEILNAIRNVLLDDVGPKMGNETHPHIRWPHVEAMRARIMSSRNRRVRVAKPS